MGDETFNNRFGSISSLDVNESIMIKKIKEQKKKSIFDFNNNYYDNSYNNRSSSICDDFMFLLPYLNNLFRKKSDNPNKLKNQSKNRVKDILRKYQSKNESILGKEPLIKNKEEAQKIVDEYTEYIEVEVKYSEKGSGYCFIIFISLVIIPICYFYYKYYNEQKNYYTERYNSINSFDGNQFSIIKRNYDIIKYNRTFVDEFSLSLYKFADLAYKRHYSLKTYMNWEIINYKNLTEDNYFYVLKEEKTKKIIVTFPGTLTPFQLLEEALGSNFVYLRKTKNILLSKYFGERAKNLLKFIFNEEMIKLLNNGYQIISTGHSLGGAMAQAFMYFAISGKIVKPKNFPFTITFNQPKVGNKLFADFLNKNSLNIRFTRGNDIVSHIPFFNFDIFGFFEYILGINKLYINYVHTLGEIKINLKNYLPPWMFCIVTFLVLLLIILDFCFYIYLFIRISKNFGNNIQEQIVSSIRGYKIYLALVLFFGAASKIIIINFKYKTYFFLIFMVFLALFIFFIIVFMILVFINDVSIILYNSYCFIRIYIIRFCKKKKIVIKKDKFCKASLKEQYKLTIAFLATAGVEIESLKLFIEEGKNQHSKANQRTGYEQYK